MNDCTTSDAYALPVPCGPITAPNATGQHLSDVLVDGGLIVRACSPDLAAYYMRNKGGIVLPRSRELDA